MDLTPKSLLDGVWDQHISDEADPEDRQRKHDTDHRNRHRQNAHSHGEECGYGQINACDRATNNHKEKKKSLKFWQYFQSVQQL